MAKIYPGLGRMMCWGKWGKCEADAKWRHARWALCDECYDNLYYYKRQTAPHSTAGRASKVAFLHMESSSR